MLMVLGGGGHAVWAKKADWRVLKPDTTLPGFYMHTVLKLKLRFSKGITKQIHYARVLKRFVPRFSKFPLTPTALLTISQSRFLCAGQKPCFTNACLLRRSPLESSVTFTVIGSRCVNTISISAGIWCAFINICEQQKKPLQASLNLQKCLFKVHLASQTWEKASLW